MKKNIIFTWTLICALLSTSVIQAQGVHINKDGKTVTLYSNNIDSLVFFSGTEGEGFSLFDELISYPEKIDIITAAIKTLEDKHDMDVSALKASNAAEESARKASDAEIWVTQNKALADIEQIKKDISRSQVTSDEALALAKANKSAIEAEVARAKVAEARIQEESDANAADIMRWWAKCDEQNDAILANAKRIEEAYNELVKENANLEERINMLEKRLYELENRGQNE